MEEEAIPSPSVETTKPPSLFGGFLLYNVAMPVNKAKNNYLGKGTPRLNCAQAVIKAFKEHFGIDEVTFRKFAAYGGGNAPEGLCGAYCAARHLIELKSPEKLKEFETFFFDQAGSLKCTEIRHGRKLSCLGCVEKAAEFTSSVHKP